MTVYVFGDSFAEQSSHAFYKVEERFTTWMEVLQIELKCDVVGHAKAGVSQEYIFQQFTEASDSFEEGDYCVYMHTEPSRRWVLEDRPELANLYMEYKGTKIRKDELEAIELYKKYLWNQSQNLAITKAITQAVNWVGLAQKCRTIQIPSFPHGNEIIHNPYVKVTGDLQTVEQNEFDSMKTRGDCYGGKVDKRHNHLSPVNHQVYGKKLYNTLYYGNELNLTKGFAENLYTSKEEYDGVNDRFDLQDRLDRSA